MRFASWLSLGLIALATPARGDAEVGAAAAVGAGLRGDYGVGALDVRGDVRSRRFAAGLGARVRTIGDEFASRDWDHPGDWLAMLRYLEWHTAREGCAEVPADPTCREDGVALAAGQLAAIDLAHLVTSYTAMIDADAPHTGIEMRVLSGETDSIMVVDDILAPVVMGGRGVWRGPSFTVGATAAGDPKAPAAMDESSLIALGVDGALPVVAAPMASQLEAGTSYLVGHGLGAWVGASTESRDEWGAIRVRVEATVGTSRWIAAPFGPLYRLEREAVGQTALLDRIRGGGLGGLGGEVSAGLEIGKWATAEAAARFRPELGGEARGRVMIARGPVAVGSWLATNPGDDRWIFAGEARGYWDKRYHVALEVSRLVTHDEMDVATPIWQATAWLGIATHE